LRAVVVPLHQPHVSADSLACRDLRHSWDYYGDLVLTEQRGQVRTFKRTLICVRCGTRRIDTYRITRSRLERVRAQYKYATGYVQPGGLSISEARFALFNEADMVSE
jgi:hypothetical protein